MHGDGLKHGLHPRQLLSMLARLGIELSAAASDNATCCGDGLRLNRGSSSHISIRFRMRMLLILRYL